MNAHEALPEFTVIGNGKMEKFMNDNIVADFAVELEQFDIEIEVARRRAGGPLVAHRTYRERPDIDVESRRPFVHASFKLFFVAPTTHQNPSEFRSSTLKSDSTNSVTFSKSSSKAKMAKVTFFRNSRSSFSLRFQFG